jgi:glycosyltransferase involved in cell wall biosynthesis
MEKQLKVLLSAHIRWYNAEAEYVHRLARGLMARGVEVLVWGWADSPVVERCRQDGVAVATLGDPGSLNPEGLRRTAKFFRTLITQAGIQIVNAHRSEGFPLVAAVARQAGAAVVRTRADMRPPRLATINRFIHRRYVDRIIAANDLLRDNLISQLNLDPDFIRTVRFGVPPDEFLPAEDLAAVRKRLGIRTDARVVGVMGRLGPVKGQEFVLKAAPKVLAAVPETVFLIIYRDLEDSDPFLPALRRSGLAKHFVFIGPGREHREAMPLADVAMIPSVGSEAHCRVALEWMALAKPIIGSRVGVIPELISHGDTGFLVQPRYSETLADCMIALLQDPERAARMGAAGRERLVREFTEDRMVDDNLAVFNQVMEHRT